MSGTERFGLAFNATLAAGDFMFATTEAAHGFWGLAFLFLIVTAFQAGFAALWVGATTPEPAQEAA